MPEPIEPKVCPGSGQPVRESAVFGGRCSVCGVSLPTIAYTPGVPDLAPKQARVVRVLICGSRGWTAIEPIRVVLEGYGRGTTLIHGASRGADNIAVGIAKSRGFEIYSFPADWKGKGRAAGPIRNREMLTANPEVVWAFKINFDWSLKTGGTENMVKIAKEAGIPTYVVSRA
jgi:hypothetical protein